MRQLSILTGVLSLSLLSTSLFAHGPTFDYVGGQIDMLDEDGNPPSLPVFAYNADLAFNFVNLGWEVVDGGGNVLVGDAIGLTVLDGAPLFGLGLTQYLFFHDGSSIDDPGAASLSILGTSTTIAESTLTAADLTLGTIGEDNGDPAFHSHLGVLLSNGSTGAYAFWVETTTSNSAIDPSDPYLVILNNSLEPAAFQRAIDDFVDYAVPEVPSFAILGGSLFGFGVGLAVRRRMARIRAQGRGRLSV